MKVDDTGPYMEDLAPPAAATGAVVLVGQLAHLPVLALVLPRALELVGGAQVLSSTLLCGRFT